jgi:hypothetical protein
LTQSSGYTLAAAYQNLLLSAKQHGLKLTAFPAISTGSIRWATAIISLEPSSAHRERGNMSRTISRREFNELAGFSAVAMGFGGAKALALGNGDVDWTSDDPHLSGNYLPVEREMDTDNLAVMAGRIPLDLSGAYMRNGPNLLFNRSTMPIQWTAMA